MAKCAQHLQLPAAHLQLRGKTKGVRDVTGNVRLDNSLCAAGAVGRTATVVVDRSLNGLHTLKTSASPSKADRSRKSTYSVHDGNGDSQGQ